jgi:hypothetical protein
LPSLFSIRHPRSLCGFDRFASAFEIARGAGQRSLEIQAIRQKVGGEMEKI